ncbi:MAG: hypothetical protein V1809_12620 [Planctomycetota bacterium]
MHVTKTKVRVLGGLWILIALLFGISVPFVAAMSCAHIMNPFGADPRWSVLHLFGGSVFWMQNVVLALGIGAAVIAFRFRPLIIFLCAYFIFTSLSICMLMIRFPEMFSFNVALFVPSVLIAVFGIATIVLVMKKETREMFKKRRTPGGWNLR